MLIESAFFECPDIEQILLQNSKINKFFVNIESENDKIVQNHIFTQSNNLLTKSVMYQKIRIKIN